MARRKTSADGDVEAWFKTTPCGACQASRLLHWQHDREITLQFDDAPQHAVEIAGHWAVVHCDYFRRRVEMPDKLSFCDARRTK
ncbi:MAG: hypothetical protein ACR2RF_09640 [Geminicoccaceae bacterium]